MPDVAFSGGPYPGMRQSLITAPGANPYEPWLGKMFNQDQVLAGDFLQKETDVLAEFYTNRPNKRLSETLEQMIVNGKSNHSNLFPFVYDENYTVQWKMVRFDQTLMDIQPSQSVPRFITYSERMRSSQHLRRGQAFRLDHDFWKTLDGQKRFDSSLAAISTNAHITVNIERIQVILNAYAYQHAHNREHGKPASSLNDVIAKQVANFGIFQKKSDGKAFYILLSEAQAAMGSVGIEANQMWGPPGFKNFLALATERENDLSVRGPKAIQNLETNARAFDSFRGLAIYEDVKWNLTNVGEGEINQLVREQQIGGSLVDLEIVRNFNNYDPGVNRGFKFFNMLKNDWEHFHVSDLIRSSARWEEDGSLHHNHDETAKSIDRINKEMNWNNDGDKRVDMFLVRDDDDGFSLTHDDYRVCKYFGEMDPLYLNNKNIGDFARSVEGRIKGDGEFDEKNWQQYHRGLELIDDLYRNATDTDIAGMEAMFDMTPSTRDSFVVAGHSGGGPQLNKHADTMPNRPFGLGSWVGMRSLASKFGASESGGWDESDVKVAHAFVAVVQKMFRIFKRIFGENHIFFDASYLPSYFRGDDGSNVNEENVFAQNLVDWNKYPLMMNRTGAPASTGLLINAPEISTTKIAEILKHPKLPTGVRNVLSNAGPYNRMVEVYQNVLGKGYADSHPNVVGVDNTFEKFFFTEILSGDTYVEGEAKAIKLLIAAVSAIHRVNRSASRNVAFTDEQLNAWRNERTGGKRQREGKEDFSGFLDTDKGDLENPNEWINTRLVLSADTLRKHGSTTLKPMNPAVNTVGVEDFKFARGNLDSRGNIHASSVATAIGQQGKGLSRFDSRSGRRPFNTYLEDPSEIMVFSLNMQERFKYANKFMSNDIMRIAAQLLITAQIHREILLRFVDERVIVPVAHLGARPFETFNMGTIFFARGGLELGMTRYMYEDMQLQNDGIRKMWVGHFTFYHDTVMKDEKNVYIIPDVIFEGYVRGMDGRMFNEKFDPQNPDPTKSMFSFMIPYSTKRSDIPDPWDLTGRFNPDFFQGNLDPSVEINGSSPHWPSAYYYLNMFNFRELNMTAVENPFNTFHQIEAWRNTVMFQETQLIDGDGGAKVIRGTGPLGSNVYPGMKNDLSGIPETLKDMEYEKEIQFI